METMDNRLRLVQSGADMRNDSFSYTDKFTPIIDSEYVLQIHCNTYFMITDQVFTESKSKKQIHNDKLRVRNIKNLILWPKFLWLNNILPDNISACFSSKTNLLYAVKPIFRDNF